MSKKILILAEKPKLGRKIAQGITIETGQYFKRNDNYLESDDYIVTWVLGHAFELRDLEEYIPEFRDKLKAGEKVTWVDSKDHLPYVPEKFLFKAKKSEPYPVLIKNIKGLLARDDIDFVVNASDPDREGHTLVNLTLMQLKNPYPVMKLDTVSQSPEALGENMNHLTDNKEKHNEFTEGVTRIFVDWAYGINYTRYATLQSGALQRVGRVISAIVNIIYERHMEIENFVPEDFFELLSEEETKGEKIRLRTNLKMKDRKMAEDYAQQYNQAKTFVSEIETVERKIRAPKLHKLTTIQSEAGKLYKMDPKTTLAIMQDLYESDFITYPRVSSEYLATGDKEEVQRVIDAHKAEGSDIKFKDNKSIFDDSKIDDHGAVILTTKIPGPNDLTGLKKGIYDIIANRFKAVFAAEDCIVDRTTITIEVEGLDEFKIKGDVYKQEGWKAFENTKTDDDILPPLNKGDIINADFKVQDNQTTPPPLYTVSSLAKVLENPFAEESKKDSEDDDDTEEYKNMLAGLSIGTQSTTSQIIDNAINSNYISLKNNKYDITDTGIMYIEILRSLGIDITKESTALLNKTLTDVRRGNTTPKEVLSEIEEEMKEVMAKEVKFNEELQKKLQNKRAPKAFAKCGYCGHDVFRVRNKENRKQIIGYFCPGCKLSLYKNNRFFEAIGFNLTDARAKTLFEKKKISASSLKSKKGTTYSANILMSYEPEKNKYPQFDMKFPPRKGGKKK